MPTPYGQIIRLKAEAEEPYRILHRNTFPSVLSRIASSNISNYSIYLHDGILFGYFEYNGNNFISDMEAISNDEKTHEWWKLTAPLQEPFPGRKPGSWWSDMEIIFQSDHIIPETKERVRQAFS
jgi:L-rhamnose mutarotase